MVHYISPAPLTFEVIDKILSKNYKLALSEDSKKLINDCKAYLDHKIESSAKPLYGITTGFGSLCKISISKEDLSQLQANLVMSHACSLDSSGYHSSDVIAESTCFVAGEIRCAVSDRRTDHRYVQS